METRPDLESRKQALRRESARYKKAVEEQIYEGYLDLVRVGKLVVIGGIAGIGVYSIWSLFRSKKPPKEAKNQVPAAPVKRTESSLSRLIKEKIALFLLSLAMEQLKKSLLKENHQNDPNNPAEAYPEEGSQD